MIRRRSSRRILGVVAVAALVAAAGLPPHRAAAQQGTPIPDQAFAGAKGFINSQPFRLSDLRGKIVLIDFWTYCCINCHHVLPDLAKLEQKYKDELVVIGVHTAKFPAERDTENIRKKVNEYRIKHPVINDADQEIWQAFRVESWPTLVLIDPAGREFGRISGEGQYQVLDRAIGHLVAQHKGKDLNESPLTFVAESDKPHKEGLDFPGKVTADSAGKRLFISDTGHNRIVVTDLDGKFIEAIGSGAEGKTDGPFARATFNRPQGTCLLGGKLYVADTESHAIREVDLESKAVATVAGTGAQSHARRGGPASQTGLNSPWDLVPLNGHTLAIAMAGPHQIWTLDLKAHAVAILAGTGDENVADGPGHSAAFAQPSGLATDGTHLYVADSEGSAIRAIASGSPHRVTTVAGTHDLPRGASLFAFGDVDGPGTRARLQHCLGLAYGDGRLYVADSYNNKVKVYDPKTGSVLTLAGNGRPGASDDPPQFYQPGGLSLIGSTLYVADTNNHAIRTVDVKTGRVRTLKLDGLAPPAPPARAPRFPNAMVLEAPKAKVLPGKAFTLDVTLAVPKGYKLNPEAPIRYLVEAPDAPDALGAGVSPSGATIAPPKAEFQVPVPLAKASQSGDSLAVKLSVSAFICKEGSEGFCTIKNFVWKVPVTFDRGGSDKVALTNSAPAGG
jgi:thiol-disulfide isomerase/thioredoxin